MVVGWIGRGVWAEGERESFHESRLAMTEDICKKLVETNF